MKRSIHSIVAIVGVSAMISVGLAQSPQLSIAPATSGVAAPPTASNLAYPQSIFVDSQSGNIWVTDFDNNRVLRFDVSLPTGVDGSGEAGVGEEFTLGQNYPNPFNPTTTIRFTIGGVVAPSGIYPERSEGGPAAAHVRLSVYDVLGREVAVLVDENKEPGNYAVTFDAGGVAGGVYFYRMIAGGHVESRSMLLVR